jgi:hypothetical protein
VAFLYRGERGGADDSHPVGAGVKRLLCEGFAGIGHLPVGDDNFVRTLGAQGGHRAQPFGKAQDRAGFDDIDVVL